MGCNTSKNVTAPAALDNKLGSEGSSHGDDRESEEDIHITQRTWGSPAPPLPDIPTSKSSTTGGKNMNSTTENDLDQIVHRKHGAAFTIQDENSPVVGGRPPRRLQALKGTRQLTIDDLLREQRDHAEKRERILREQKERLSNSNRRRSTKSLREFEEAQRLYKENKRKVEKVLKNKEEILNEKVTKVRKHNSKVVLRKRSTLKDSLNDSLNLSGKIEHDNDYNKSESESWPDNDSIKNIYDQMDYIKPVSGLAHAVNNNTNHSDEEFFS